TYLKQIKFAMNHVSFIKPVDPDITTIGMMNHQEASDLIGNEQRFTDQDLYKIKQTWHAITDDTPEQLQKLSSSMQDDHFGLKDALTAYKKRYPAFDTGLDRSDLLILENTKRQA